MEKPPGIAAPPWDGPDAVVLSRPVRNGVICFDAFQFEGAPRSVVNQERTACHGRIWHIQRLRKSARIQRAFGWWHDTGRRVPLVRQGLGSHSRCR